MNIDLSTSIEVQNYTKRTLVGQYGLIFVRSNDIPVQMEIINSVDINCMMYINPVVTTIAKYQILPTPKYYLTLTPDRDAFVRSKVPKLNYGKEKDLFIGYTASNQESLTSYLHFDINSIPRDKILKKVSLRLFYAEPQQKIQDVDILFTSTGSTEWSESGITWHNQPTGNILKKTVRINGNYGYLEFDMLDDINNLYQNNQDSSIALKANNTQQDLYTRFFSREHTNYAPQLAIEYYDNKIYTDGDFDLPSSMYVLHRNDLSCTFIINQKNRNDDLTTKIGVYIPSNTSSVMDCTIEVGEKVTKSELPVEFAVQRPYLSAQMRVTHNDFKNVNVDLQVGQRQINEIDTTMMVIRTNMQTQILVKAKRSLDLMSELQVIEKQSSDMMTSLIVSRNSMWSQIRVMETKLDDVETYIQVIENKFSDLEVSFSVVKSSLPTEMNVFRSSSISTQLRVIENNKSDMGVSLFVVQHTNLPVSLNIFKYQDLAVQMQVFTQFLPVDLRVIQTKWKNLRSSMRVMQSSHKDVGVELFVVQHTNLPINMNVFWKQDFNAEMDVFRMSNIPTEIRVGRFGDSDITTEFLVMIKAANDILTTFEIGGMGNMYAARPYAYII